jgi:hypothetical protein
MCPAKGVEDQALQLSGILFIFSSCVPDLLGSQSLYDDGMFLPVSGCTVIPPFYYILMTKRHHSCELPDVGKNWIAHISVCLQVCYYAWRDAKFEYVGPKFTWHQENQHPISFVVAFLSIMGFIDAFVP